MLSVVDRGDFSWNQEEDFEVEAILDHGLDEVYTFI